MRSSLPLFAAGVFALGLALACGHEVLEPGSQANGSGGPSSPAPSPTSTTTPDGPPSPPTPGFDKDALLGALADCAVSVYADANTKTSALAAAVTALVAAPADVPARDAARAAYYAAMDAWQVAEVFQFGPLGMNSSPGGQELRDPVYSWPLFSRCTIEGNLVSQRYSQPQFATDPINTRGLMAVEYMLFYEGTENACPAANPINATGTWAAAFPELPARRAAYAKVVTDDLARRTSELVASWGPEGQNFATAFKTAGRGSTVYPSDQSALNAVNLGLFYIEGDVKDMKLAWPANVSGHCAEATCPQGLESQFANASRDHIVKNLEGFRKLFVSCDGNAAGLGFAAYLRAANAAPLADRMTQELDASIALANGIEDRSLRTALADGRVRGLYDQVKKVTDDLKTEFVTVLDLELPKEIQGDND